MCELSANLFSSWAHGWCQYIKMKDHTSIYRMWLLVLQAALETLNPVFLETLVDKVDFETFHNKRLDHTVLVRGYRLWIPTTVIGASSFAAALVQHLPDQSGIDIELQSIVDEGPRGKRKKRRVSTPVESVVSEFDALAPFKSKADFLRAVRLYFSGRERIDDIVFETETNIEDHDLSLLHPHVPDQDASGHTATLSASGSALAPHILDVLAASKYFSAEATITKYENYRIPIEQTDLQNYILDLGTGVPHFAPPEYVKTHGLIRTISYNQSRFVAAASELFNYMLPSFVPPKTVVIEKIKCILDSTGVPYDPSIESLSVEELLNINTRTGDSVKEALFEDPVYYSPIQSVDALAEGGIEKQCLTTLDTILSEVYPIMTRLRVTYQHRIHRAKDVSPLELERWYANLTRELNTITSTVVQGIPVVYCDLGREFKRMWGDLSDPQSTVASMTKKMVFNRPPHVGKYTGLGAKIGGIVVGSRNMLRLLDRQTTLFILLYMRHFSITANKTGTCGFFIISGPPDTGKSMVCQEWLTCIAKALVKSNDGMSGKAWTALDSTADLRCCFQDELKNLVSRDGTDTSSDPQIKAMQTLISNGVGKYDRLVQDPSSGSFKKEKLVIALRQMLVTCTNALSNVPDAIQSRASIIPVVDTKHKKRHEVVTTNSLIASKRSASNQRNKEAFSMTLQFMSTLQHKYWAVEAIGGIPDPDDSLFIVFEHLVASESDLVLPPRKLVDIRDTANAIMVFDLVTLWYTRGLGAQCNYNPIEEAIFYATRSFLRAEHIITSLSMYVDSTSMESHLIDVQIVIKELIKCDDDGMPQLSSDSNYFALISSRRTFKADIARHPVCRKLGKGLTEQILSSIETGITRGLPNFKFETSNSTDLVLVNKHFISAVLTPLEAKILDHLKTYLEDPDLYTESFDETFYVFRSGIRERICVSHEGMGEEFKNITYVAFNKALTWFGHRSLADDTPLWSTPTSIEVAKEVSPPEEGVVSAAIQFDSDPSRYKIYKQEFAPLVVHKSLLDSEKGTEVRHKYNSLFEKLLAVSGTYPRGTRIFAGINPDYQQGTSIDIYVTSPYNHVTVNVRNPLYTPDHGFDMLIDSSELDDDPLFPRSKKVVKFNSNSNIEELICRSRYSRITGRDGEHCPKRYLPKETLFL